MKLPHILYSLALTGMIAGCSNNDEFYIGETYKADLEDSTASITPTHALVSNKEGEAQTYTLTTILDHNTQPNTTLYTIEAVSDNDNDLKFDEATRQTKLKTPSGTANILESEIIPTYTNTMHPQDMYNQLRMLEKTLHNGEQAHHLGVNWKEVDKKTYKQFFKTYNIGDDK